MGISYKFVYKFRHCHFPYMSAITKPNIVFVHKCPVVCLTAIYIRYKRYALWSVSVFITIYIDI